jgi:hypothetical protein
MRPLTLTRRAAAGYYERKNYTDDKMAALHAKLPAMNARELLARFRTLRERIEKKDACSADLQKRHRAVQRRRRLDEFVITLTRGPQRRASCAIDGGCRTSCQRLSRASTSLTTLEQRRG